MIDEDVTVIVMIYSFPASLLSCDHFRDMSFSLEEFTGTNDVPEGTLRAMVARTTEVEPLAELARALGDVSGPNLGVGVHIDHLTGAVKGSVFQLYGEDPKAEIMSVKFPGRQLWEKVDRKLEVSMTIRVMPKYLLSLLNMNKS